MKKIPLTQGLFALIDDADLPIVMKWKWFAVKKKNGYYASSYHKKSGKKIYMHRLIKNVTNKYEVDHKNGNTLDNQRNNLRTVTHHQNLMNQKRRITNSSGHIGISFDKKNKKWRASITVNGISKNLGRFKDIEDAINERKKAETECFGEFVRDIQFR